MSMLAANPTVFVTYASGDPAHDTAVLSFVNFLRSNGFDAVNDTLLRQQESSVDFRSLMLRGFVREKVIVVLSKRYKEKSQEENKGAFFEYRYILEDIPHNSNKYLFVTFSTPTKYAEIAPPWIVSRDILDLSQDDEMNRLFAKLQGKDIYTPEPIAPAPTAVETKQVPDFLEILKKTRSKTI